MRQPAEAIIGEGYRGGEQQRADQRRDDEIGQQQPAHLFLRLVGARAHGVDRAIHRAEVNPRQIFADHAEREQLRAGENGDNRGQKRETRHDNAE